MPNGNINLMATVVSCPICTVQTGSAKYKLQIFNTNYGKKLTCLRNEMEAK